MPTLALLWLPATGTNLAFLPPPFLPQIAEHLAAVAKHKADVMAKLEAVVARSNGLRSELESSTGGGGGAASETPLHRQRRRELEDYLSSLNGIGCGSLARATPSLPPFLSSLTTCVTIDPYV